MTENKERNVDEEQLEIIFRNSRKALEIVEKYKKDKSKGEKNKDNERD